MAYNFSALIPVLIISVLLSSGCFANAPGVFQAQPMYAPRAFAPRPYPQRFPVMQPRYTPRFTPMMPARYALPVYPPIQHPAMTHYQRPMPPVIAPPQSAQQPPALQREQSRQPDNEFAGYLGMNVDTIPSQVAAQLPEEVPKGQGVLVRKFAPDSPAEASDIRPYDVILSYDGEKLIHPSQFVKRVREDSPGHKVTLEIVRNGKITKVPVTIGAQVRPKPREYNGVAIQSLGKDNYRASIRFLDAAGHKQLREYEGTRNELFKLALAADDLPYKEHQQFLLAVRPTSGGSKNNGMGSFFPFGNSSDSGTQWMDPGKYFPWK